MNISNPNRGCLIAGGSLVLLGVAFFAMQFLGSLWGALLLFGVGAVLLVVYFYTRRFVLLIVGVIFVLLGLATTGFSLLLLLSRAWPLILIVLGLVILAGAYGLTRRRNQ